MALQIIDWGSDKYQQVLALRDEVLRKPLGIQFSQDEIDNEKNNIHLVAHEDGRLLGCCMLVQEEPETVRLRQMAVVNDVQGRGIGRALMTFAENMARDKGYKKIIMHARKAAVGFYEKLGYATRGEEFKEVTIPHFIMEKQL